jgi:hypothetical protein
LAEIVTARGHVNGRSRQEAQLFMINEGKRIAGLDAAIFPVSGAKRLAKKIIWYLEKFTGTMNYTYK